MNRLTIAVLLGSSLAAFGCSRENSPPGAEVSSAEVRQQSTPFAAAPTVELEKRRFVGAAQQELDQLKFQLAELDNRAQAASGEAKARLVAQVATLEGQLMAVETRLAELKTVPAESWREAQASFSQEMRELKQSFERNKQEVKQG
jgi:capsule polysaccharide export protein KpsE/RkpR